MPNQNLFEALQRVCDFTALETDMQEIIDAVEKDKKEYEHLKCKNFNLVEYECNLGKDCKCPF